MNEFTLEVIRRYIDYSRQASREIRDCSMRFSRDDSFGSIYNSLANIFEHYVESYELILTSERLTEVPPHVAAPTVVKAAPVRRVRKRTRVIADAAELTT